MMKDLFQFFFIISIGVFFFFFALELIKEGLVSNHFDLNIILVVVIFSGFMVIVYDLKNNN